MGRTSLKDQLDHLGQISRDSSIPPWHPLRSASQLQLAMDLSFIEASAANDLIRDVEKVRRMTIKLRQRVINDTGTFGDNTSAARTTNR